LISVDCASISSALLRVLGFYRVVVGSSGDSVWGLISSFDSTTSGSRGTKLVALNLALMLLDKKTS
jgi:hypothetical protein